MLAMRALITRVSSASVTVDGQVVSELPRPGLLVLAGVARDEDPERVRWLASRISKLRILDDARSVAQTGAPVLVVSQFTLYASTKKGGVPSWSRAAPADEAEPLVEFLCTELESLGTVVHRGRFGAHMEVASVNDGPVTIWMDTAERG
ncbi:D-aminoacyl-tRNA deacylase [Tessaracoccus terricola]